MPPTINPVGKEPAAAGKLWSGEYSVLIESVPTGATVVINGIPVGPTPRRVLLPGNPQGFSRSLVSIRVRFVAEKAGEKSQSVEQKLTLLDRIPTKITFTRTGAERTLPDAL